MKRQLPPGQSSTRKFPVVGERSAAPEAADLVGWRLEVTGRVAAPLELDWPAIVALPQAERVVDIHCVTGWSQFAMCFGGFPLDLLLDRAQPLADARFVRFAAYSERSHDTTVPLELARQDTWLVHSWDGEPLAPEHGYPLRTVTPSRYFYKSLKWVRRIELLAEDRLGYWERESHYHNQGDPWAGDQRFVTGSINPRKLAIFLAAEKLDRYRGPSHIFLGVDLRDWDPVDRDLRELHLKNCDLRGVSLAGSDLRGANLSLSNLRRAALAGADLRGADLEGVDFVGADLSGADLGEALLSAARFVELGSGGLQAKVSGLRWDGCRGLLEDQEAFLRRHA